MIIEDLHVGVNNDAPYRWTWGTEGVAGRFGSVHPPHTHANLHYWDYSYPLGEQLRFRRVKCRSYRRAVRVLRWHLMGYKV